MTSSSLSRRDFLKLGAAALGGLAFSRYAPNMPYWDEFDDGDLVRVSAKSVSVYSQPDDTSQIVSQRYRDEVVNVYKEVTASTPGYNPVWYRVWGGYIHRARIQKVKVIYNQPLASISKKGQLAQVTVPFTQSMRYTTNESWQPLYRLYYDTTHWIIGIDEGPDGQPWYRLLDELLEIKYHVPATHLRPIPEDEWAPVSPEIPFEKKRIEVDLNRQVLTAFESDKSVFQTTISSGIAGLKAANGIPTATPRGEFNIQSKYPSKHMGNGSLASDIEAYELVGVPWTCFFESKGYAFHGTYWHDNFGVPMSRGCVNMRPMEARWLFRWALPISPPQEFETPGKVDRKGLGTEVKIF